MTDEDVLKWTKVATAFRWAGRLSAALLGVGTVLSMFDATPLQPLTAESVRSGPGPVFLAAGVCVLLSLPFVRAAAILLEGPGRKVRRVLVPGTVMVIVAFVIAFLFARH